MATKPFLTLTAILGGTLACNAATILSASFNEPGYDEAGNTSGTTASNIPWTSDFGETASAISFSGSASSFINGGNSDADALGISGNIETVGPWTGSFTLTPTQGLEVTSFNLLSYAISGGGTHQLNDHSYQFSAEILDGTTSVATFAAQSVLEPGGAAGSTFSLTPGSAVNLSSGTTYTFEFTADYSPEDGSQLGNNLGLGSIEIEGVPEPSSTALIGLASLGLLLRRRK